MEKKNYLEKDVGDDRTQSLLEPWNLFDENYWEQFRRTATSHDQMRLLVRVALAMHGVRLEEKDYSMN